MTLWLDEQLSPLLVEWITKTFELPCDCLSTLGLQGASDRDIFAQAKASGSVLITKDRDFLDLQRQLGPPPQIVWLRCGNRSTEQLKIILAKTMPEAIVLLSKGEPIVEIA